MTQEETLQYNKRCALFLGAIDNTHEWGFMLQPNELNLSFDLFDEKLFSNDGGSGWFVKDLKFHSDWNWIMEVVEAIEKKAWVSIQGCAVDISTIVNLNAPTKKEAVVEAINQFLIWCEQNKTT